MAALPSSCNNAPQDEAVERAATCSSDDEERSPEKSLVGKNGRRRRSFSATVAEPAWNRIRGRNGSEARLARPDGRAGGGSQEDGTQFFLGLIVESLDGSKAFVAGSVLSLTVWSVLCALFAGWLSGLADGDALWAERWLDHIQGCSSAISTVGEGRMEGMDGEVAKPNVCFFYTHHRLQLVRLAKWTY